MRFWDGVKSQPLIDPFDVLAERAPPLHAAPPHALLLSAFPESAEFFREFLFPSISKSSLQDPTGGHPVAPPFPQRAGRLDTLALSPGPRFFFDAVATLRSPSRLSFFLPSSQFTLRPLSSPHQCIPKKGLAQGRHFRESSPLSLPPTLFPCRFDPFAPPVPLHLRSTFTPVRWSFRLASSSFALPFLLTLVWVMNPWYCAPY